MDGLVIYRIDVGDFVSVNFHTSRTTLSHRATVLSKPCATGDSWIFKDEESGQIHYVSEGCTISKLESDAKEV